MYVCLVGWTSELSISKNNVNMWFEKNSDKKDCVFCGQLFCEYPNNHIEVHFIATMNVHQKYVSQYIHSTNY